jgi:hypothetical protein
MNLEERLQEQGMKVLLKEDAILELELKLKDAKIALERERDLYHRMREVVDMINSRPELLQAMRKLVAR